MIKKLLILSSILTTTLISLRANAQDFLPSNLLLMNDYFAHHVIVAEKSTHTLYLYENDEGKPRLIKTFQMATGQKVGNKEYQGDKRTPEGVYFFNQFLDHNDLIKRHGELGAQYGVGAFVLDYPNPIDKAQGKTGGGIWLHSTDNEPRIDKGLDSKGCLVAHNVNLIDIARYIEINKTNIVVVHNLKFFSEETWKREKNEVIDTFNGWLDAWSKEDTDKYLSHYSRTDFEDPFRGRYNTFAQYKRAVFSNPGKPEIKISNLTVLKADDYVVVTFKQDYKSNTVNDIGKKTLYLKRDPYYKWKIVAERWQRIPMDITNEREHLSFEPSQRFFTSQDPKQIFTLNLTLTRPYSEN
ncbi:MULTISPECIES: L,D-transpeptidase family protein [Halobacteriovorax]|uniref:L,D-TPase catalytic domain-containing protein n=1 Tax=Halobacteriovorax vibrionivorans TaxID=2152716 RepID=A0ABY0IE64_9BACT|nr:MULTISPECIES: L,D-transpeptidase family protein [Halobacteriovorax]AYF44234.1 L,D-transpeptidase catalytic domain protein [Halobacteriovorax sp. BALOs_7]RZF21238.1 hypothetical protein DAY19_06025 [Halobacteriovorax vibrionivorans]TGD48004.1 hypothetical protein EP118_06105 [Halobacteriovorax sp. Y22]